MQYTNNYSMVSQCSDDGKSGAVVSSEDEEVVETAPEKRLRLAKDYLSKLQDEGVFLCCLVS